MAPVSRKLLDYFGLSRTSGAPKPSPVLFIAVIALAVAAGFATTLAGLPDSVAVGVMCGAVIGGLWAGIGLARRD